MNRIAAPFLAIVSLFVVSSASAQTFITQAKALAGGVTPGDTPGFPITLTQPGAYRLDSNLTVPSGQIGIIVTVDEVDIDLNGFIMTGSNAGSYALVSNRAGGRIHGGVVSRFSGSGIYLRGEGWTIEDMQITGNGGIGIDATGWNNIWVRNSVVSGNRAGGIHAKDFGRVESSKVVFNGGFGLSLGDDVVIEGSTVSLNRLAGIFLQGGGRIERNDVSANGAEGIITQNGSLISSNVMKRNVSYGIFSAPTLSTITNNYLNGNSTVGNLTTQINGGSNLYGNVCVGKIC